MPILKKTTKPIENVDELFINILKEKEKINQDDYWTIIVEETFDNVERFHFTYYKNGLLQITKNVEKNGRFINHRTIASVNKNGINKGMSYNEPIYADPIQFLESCKKQGDKC